MITELMKLIFEQAKNETPNNTKTGLSKHISKKIEENDKSKIFSYKTFTRYYDKYIMGKEGVIGQPQTEIIEELCRYIGYDNYQDFVSKNKSRVSMTESYDFVNRKTVEFKTNRKLITKIGGKTFVANKALISLATFVVLFISYFSNDWYKRSNDFSMKEYYKNAESEKFIKEKGMFENARSTFTDTSYFVRQDELRVLAYEQNE